MPGNRCDDSALEVASTDPVVPAVDDQDAARSKGRGKRKSDRRLPRFQPVADEIAATGDGCDVARRKLAERHGIDPERRLGHAAAVQHRQRPDPAEHGRRLKRNAVAALHCRFDPHPTDQDQRTRREIGPADCDRLPAGVQDSLRRDALDRWSPEFDGAGQALAIGDKNLSFVRDDHSTRLSKSVTLCQRSRSAVGQNHTHLVEVGLGDVNVSERVRGDASWGGKLQSCRRRFDGILRVHCTRSKR